MTQKTGRPGEDGTVCRGDCHGAPGQQIEGRHDVSSIAVCHGLLHRITLRRRLVAGGGGGTYKAERSARRGWLRRNAGWRGAGAVDRGGLENRCTPLGYRGFESLPLRQTPISWHPRTFQTAAESRGFPRFLIPARFSLSPDSPLW